MPVPALGPEDTGVNQTHPVLGMETPWSAFLVRPCLRPLQTAGSPRLKPGRTSLRDPWLPSPALGRGQEGARAAAERAVRG